VFNCIRCTTNTPPYIIQIGDIGIVHAEVPLFINGWDELLEKTEKQHIDTLISLLWGRKRIERDVNKNISGIEKIYCGHSIVQEQDNYANHRFIDTGAYLKVENRLYIEKI